MKTLPRSVKLLIAGASLLGVACVAIRVPEIATWDLRDLLTVALLAGLTIVSWLIWQALAAVSLGVLAVPVVILFLAVLGVGGHRCVTVVQHWH